MGRFSGRTVYITGGSSGIGLATAHELVRGGARVLLLARGEARLQEAIASLEEAASGAEVSYRCLDVADRTACDEVLPGAVADFGAPDILINSHGFAIPGHFEELTNEDLADQWGVNLVGIWNTTQVLLPWLEERRGTIANVSSLGGFLGTLGYSAYNATKFGVIGLSESLRNELVDRGVRVQVLCPPDTDTPGFERENRTKPEVLKVMSEAVPLMRPEAVAKVFVRRLDTGKFLITAGFMTGLTRVLKGLSPRLAFAALDMETRKARRKVQRRS